MIVPQSTKPHSARRLVSAAVLLFVFFLPLHVHFLTSTAKVNNDCACAYSTRTQASPVAISAHWTPTFEATFIVVYEPQASSSLLVHAYTIRAPPPVTSL